jgi:oxygen-dependent protoporphyrinogen oxidase
MPDRKQVVVIGAGISGLCCAYRLQQMGLPVTLIDSSPDPGGLMASNPRPDGFLFESGPQSFQGTPSLMQLIRELKLEPELCVANPRAPRYILRHGRMQKIATSPPALLASSLLSMRSRWKIASEPFRRTQPPPQEESVANFVRRKFGHEILEYLVSPFVSGVYAGDPEKLSLRAAFPSLEQWEREHGSVLRGAIKSQKEAKARREQTPGANAPPTLCSFQGGVGVLPKALASALGDNFRPSTAAVALAAGTAPGSCNIQIQGTAGTASTIAAFAVVLAAPAYVTSHLLRPIAAPIADALSGIAYAGVAVATLGYYAKQAPAPLDGFGVLLPRSERRRTLGVIFNSSLFPGRAPRGQFAITSFLGGATDEGIVQMSDSAILAVAEKDAADILGISGSPAAAALWRHPKALPQYNMGHGHIVESVRAAARNLPGIFFAGNYLEGPAIGKCVELAFKTAESVRDSLA